MLLPKLDFLSRLSHSNRKEIKTNGVKIECRRTDGWSNVRMCLYPCDFNLILSDEEEKLDSSFPFYFFHSTDDLLLSLTRF